MSETRFAERCHRVDTAGAVKTVALLPAHPAQVWLLSQVAAELKPHVRVLWYLRDKDRSAEIARGLGIDFNLLSKAGTGFLGNGIEMLIDSLKALHETRKQHIDLWVTKFGAGNIAARIMRRRSISFNDDDVDLVPLIAETSYRFADTVMVTDVTRMGKWEEKACRYPSFHELFYLHPKRFSFDASVRDELGLKDGECYGIVRLSALTAHHDHGIRGIATELLVEILERYGHRIKIFISAEKALDKRLSPYRFPIKVERMHHALAGAEFFLGDSQTMTAESAVLGTPALRVSDFVGRISYLDELESYGLAFGYRPGDERSLLQQLEQILTTPGMKEEFAKRRDAMLSDKIDPAPWFAARVLESLEADV